MIPGPAAPPPVIEVRCVGPLWRLSSTDGLLSGAFRDRRAALRHARDEAEAHPGYVVVLREE
ncbi:hypothetical protein MMB232_00029 [Brevundimonas subvibrioides]|uniref:hypothetical protein n=1 Tax=Brevundimonas subvibrioides TaxID=74313 RepID=UPI0032D5AC22